ncbi:hypothetical protein [Acetonema longum]|nr:hypothetical protein [Acetonema longum]
MGSPRFNVLERQEELKAVGLIGSFQSVRFVLGSADEGMEGIGLSLQVCA